MKVSSNWEDYFYSNAQVVCGAVAIKFNGKAEFIGSATYLAPGLFITAKHVATEPLNRLGLMRQIHENKKYGQYSSDISTKDFIIEVIQMPKLEYKVAQRWNIRWMGFAHDMDFAILTSDDTSGPITELIPSMPVASVNIHPFPIGTKIISCGFFGKEGEVNYPVSDTATNHALTYQGRKGKIVDLHMFSVASIADPPVYEMDNKIEHMMSGGPVCNYDGEVIAINSSSLNAEEGGQERTISTLFLRNMFFQFNYLMNGRITKTSLYELAKIGRVGIIGYQHLSQTGTHIKWSPSSACSFCQKLKSK